MARIPCSCMFICAQTLCMVFFMDTNKRRGRTAAQDKYDRENVETISFKTKKGARVRLKDAATITNQSINGFIRATLNEAVKGVTGVPMEHSEDTK